MKFWINLSQGGAVRIEDPEEKNSHSSESKESKEDNRCFEVFDFLTFRHISLSVCVCMRSF